MRSTSKKTALAAAVMAVSLLGSSMVLADGGRRYDGWKDAGQQRDYGRQARHWKGHRDGHRDYRHSRDHHHGGQVTRYYKYDDDDDGDEKLLIGLVLGGLIGYAINQGGYGY